MPRHKWPAPTLDPIAVEGGMVGTRWIEYFTDPPLWEDLRFPAQGISIGALTVPPGQQADTGALLFDGGGLIETIGIIAQLPHAWVEGSVIRPHVHWAKSTNGVGGVVWRIRYRWFNNEEVPPAWSAQIQGTDGSDPGATQKQVITSFGDVDGEGKAISSIFQCQVGRVSNAAGDTYVDDVVLYEFDIHYQSNSAGSAKEFVKG